MVVWAKHHPCFTTEGVSMNTSGENALAELIQASYDCPCHLVRTVAVRKTFKGRTLWEGEVGIFRLDRDNDAVDCYGWMEDSLLGIETPYIVLATPEIQSP